MKIIQTSRRKYASLKDSSLLPFKCKLSASKFILFLQFSFQVLTQHTLLHHLSGVTNQSLYFHLWHFKKKYMNIWHTLYCNSSTLHQLTIFFRFKPTHCTAYLLSFCTLPDLLNFTNFWTELSLLILSKTPKPLSITAANGSKCQHYSHNASETEEVLKQLKAFS